MSHVAHLALDVGSRLAQGGAVVHAAVEGFFGALEERRLDDLDAVQRLVVELGIARRAAVAAQAEAARLSAETIRLRGEVRSCSGALAHERARADRAEHALGRVVGAVRAQRAA